MPIVHAKFILHSSKFAFVNYSKLILPISKSNFAESKICFEHQQNANC